MEENEIDFDSLRVGDAWRCDRFRDDRNVRLYCCKNVFPEGIDGTCIRDPKAIIGSEASESSPGYIEFPAALKVNNPRLKTGAFPVSSRESPGFTRPS